MRCRAYQIPSEVYRELEAQILAQVADGERERLLYLLTENDLEVELLSGEWRLLFDAASDFYQVEDVEQRRARMAISPDEMADFVAMLREPNRRSEWGPISFGLAELADALPVGSDLVGLVIVEESDDWLWTESPYEMLAIRPDVYNLLKGRMHQLIANADDAALARLCGDHCEGSVEFSNERWSLLLEHARDQVPELARVFSGVLAPPSDYNTIREAISIVSDPMYQPSLDAWLRVHADRGPYALYFRDVGKERD